jgi:late-transcription coactivator
MTTTFTFMEKLENISTQKFHSDIEALVADRRLDYEQAIIYYCEQHGIDLEAVPELLTPPLKNKLQTLYSATHRLKKMKTNKGLPI